VKLSGEFVSAENPRQALWLTVLGLAALELTGCVIGPKNHPPAAPAPPAYKEVGDWKPAQPNDQILAVIGGRFFRIRNWTRWNFRSTYRIKILKRQEVEQAKTQLQTTRAQAIDVGVARAQYEHAVAILIGKPPAEFSLPPLPLTAPPPHIPISMPSERLERRPDIAGGERRVASASAQIGVAMSAYYPPIILSASGGFESASITSLLNGPSRLWSVGLSAVGTLFDGAGAAPSPTRRVPLTTLKSLPIERAC
jgi:hypothetical protein